MSLKMPESNGYYVYIIECGDNSLYTGYARNLKKRFLEHENGSGAKYTRGRGPLKLLYYKSFDSASLALKEEYRIKRLKRLEKLEIIKNFHQ